MRFLHAADLHLDSPLRGLDRYEGAPVERLRTATRGALGALVDRALAEPVDFVLFAGDLYDRDWQDFHTGLFFREQMVRLDRAGIRVFIAHGNHDAQGVISRQLSLPANVTVFSSRTPETARIDALGVAIHGRSFPDRAVGEDWVPTYPAPVAGCFNIGVLHTSLGGRPGHDTYAPTELATLCAKGYDYWALGHVHARELVCEAPRVVFPGNLQGRHANETGPKGCELVRVEAGRIEAEFIALDVVRWHQVELALDGVDTVAGLHQAFHVALAPLRAEAADRLLALRISLRGVSALFDLEARQPGGLEAELRAAAQDVTGADVWIERVRVALTAPFDRDALLARDDAIGEFVRLAEAYSNDLDSFKALAHAKLGGLLGGLAPELASDDIPRLDSPDELRQLLNDAEATALARLMGAGESQ